MSAGTHWKKNIDTNWIGCHVLPNGQDIVVTLLRVEFKKGVKVAGKSQDKYVAYFDKNPYFDKPMLLNKTNLKRVEILTGTPIIENWGNLNMKVTICQEMDKCIGGGEDWALRIKAKAPVLTLPILTIDSPNFKGCKEALKQVNPKTSVNYTVQDFRTKYQISKEVEAELLKP
jgi:hypothetical protein